LLIKHGASFGENELKQFFRNNYSETGDLEYSKFIQKASGYNTLGLFSEADISLAIARQILERKKHNPQDQAKIVGVSSEIPFEVVLTYEKNLKLLGETSSANEDPDITQARITLAESFLKQFTITRNSQFGHRVLPDHKRVEVVGESGDGQDFNSPKSPIISLLEDYDHFHGLINGAEEIFAKRQSRNDYKQQVAFQVEGARKSLDDGFFSQTSKGGFNIEPEDFPNVVAKIEAIISSSNFKPSNKNFLKIFSTLNPKDNHKISTKDFNYLMAQIPQNSGFEDSIKALQMAFFNQFAKSSVVDLAQRQDLKTMYNFLFELLPTTEDLKSESIHQVLKSDVAKSLKGALNQLDLASKLQEISQEYQTNDNKENAQKMISEFLKIHDDKDHALLISVKKSNLFVGLNLDSLHLKVAQRELDEFELSKLKERGVVLSSYNATEEAKNPNLQKAGTIIARKILGLGDDETPESAIQKYRTEMFRIEKFEQDGANKDDIQRTRESLSGALIVLTAGVKFEKGSPDYEILKSAKDNCKNGIIVLGALKFTPEQENQIS
jgi:hypothetical protein